MDDSPIADAALEALADRIAATFRVLRRRAPQAVGRRVRELMEQVRVTVGTPDPDLGRRLALARELERLDAELHGRDFLLPDFYAEGRLGIIQAWDPVRIRETVDDRRVRQHMERYEARVARQQDRLRWFYERAGLEVDDRPAAKPWELPYAAMEEVREYLWGKVQRY